MVFHRLHLAYSALTPAPRLLSNQAGMDESTALMFAAERGAIKSIQAWQARGGALDTVLIHQAGGSYTALQLAAFTGHALAVRTLLACGMDPSVTAAAGSARAEGGAGSGGAGVGHLPLHLAARYGHAAALEALLEAGVDPNAADEFGQTALHYAAAYGHLPACTVLARFGADVYAAEVGGRRADQLAAAAGQGGTAGYLRRLAEAGASKGGAAPALAPTASFAPAFSPAASAPPAGMMPSASQSFSAADVAAAASAANAFNGGPPAALGPPSPQMAFAGAGGEPMMAAYGGGGGPSFDVNIGIGGGGGGIGGGGGGGGGAPAFFGGPPQAPAPWDAPQQPSYAPAPPSPYSPYGGGGGGGSGMGGGYGGAAYGAPPQPLGFGAGTVSLRPASLYGTLSGGGGGAPYGSLASPAAQLQAAASAAASAVAQLRASPPTIAPSRARLRDWLTAIGMPELFAAFMKQGFDDIDFLYQSGGVTPSDCHVLGVMAHGLRRKLCAVQSLRAFTTQGIMERWHASVQAATAHAGMLAQGASAQTQLDALRAAQLQQAALEEAKAATGKKEDDDKDDDDDDGAAFFASRQAFSD